MGDQKNLILAIVLSVAIILAFQLVIAPPQRPAAPQATTQPATPSTTPGTPGATPPAATPPQGTQPTTPGTVPPAAPPRTASREDILKATPRVPIDAKRVTGSISLKGGMLDDVTLRDYREAVPKTAANIHILNPAAAGKNGKAYYVVFGWQPVAGARPVTLPDDNTLWQSEGGPLAPGRPVTLTWTNPQGLKFSRRFEIDNDYLVTVRETVENTGGEPVQLAPYSIAKLVGEPKGLGFFILHEGPIAVFRKTAEDVRQGDRLRLVLLPDQAVLPALDWLFTAGRQLRRRHPALHGLVKLAFFPLANKAYKSMATMKALSRRWRAARALQGRQGQAHEAGDDGALQEGAVNPAGGLPADPAPDPGLLRALQGAVRHHRDAPRALLRLDPGSLGARPDLLFNLFGLLPWDGAAHRLEPFLLGIWPLIMGATMWAQQKLNPQPPDPIQAKIFAWMPVIFTFMLASFPAGLVIYWAWNNICSRSRSNG
jgi:YidC/Oxa1 family membrane protein insertase